jgi:DNA-binding beta-propeller fold protein YncE
MKKRILSLLTAAFIGLISFNSCSDDNDSDQKPSLDYRIIVVNEGNFMSGNADISVIGRDNKITNKVFESTNNRPLGDVGQSISLINDKLFVTLNNSAKIEVFDPITFKSIETILDDTQSSSPLYICPVSDQEAVVSDLGNTMMLINTDNNRLKKTFNVNSPTKQMIASGNYIYIFSTEYVSEYFSSGKVLIMDKNDIENPVSLKIADTNEDWFNARVVKDKNGDVWFLTSYALTCIDASTKKISKELKFADSGITSSSYPQSTIDINKKGDNIYLLASDGTNNAIYKIGITSDALPESPLFTLDSEITTPYNMAVSPSETVVICDALDYAQSGKVYELSTTGEIVNEWTAGISPQYIFFADK